MSNNTKQIARATDRVAFLLMGNLIEIGDTHRVFTVPKDKRTDDYISGTLRITALQCPLEGTHHPPAV